MSEATGKWKAVEFVVQDGDSRFVCRCNSREAAEQIAREHNDHAALCRGARDEQLKMMHGMGIIVAATDAAWNKKRVEIGMKPTEIKDPKKRS